jgi:hypothetical protein
VLMIEKCLTAQMRSIFSKEINEINKVSCVEVGVQNIMSITLQSSTNNTGEKRFIFMSLP